MKIIYLFLFYCVLFCFGQTQAQVVSSKGTSGKGGVDYKINWTVDPFDYRVFIENMGQFTADIQTSDKIVYGAQLGDVYAFITDGGNIIYKYTENPSVITKANGTKVAVDPDDVNWKVKPKEHYLVATWKGSTQNVSTIAGEEQSYYYTYPSGKKGTLKANVFKKVTCMNVYPGIDVEYVFPADKTGIKYTLIVHPGANPALIKLKYDGAEDMLIDNEGNVNIKTGWGNFTDHAPVSYYSENTAVSIGSGYSLNDNEETFTVNNSDATKTLLIDPWSTNWTQPPNFGNSGYDGAYDVDFDYAGNIYVYGGYNPFKLIKFNSAGTSLWTFNTTNFAAELYGDFCVDKASGISFVLQGFGGGGNALTDKVSASGASLGTFPPTGTSCLDEQWRASYDLCDHIILVAGGGVNASLQAETIDTNLTAATMTNVLGAGTALHDFSLIGTDPILPVGYMATARGVVYPTVADNVLLQMPLPTMAPVAYNVADNYSFVEVGSIAYVGGFAGEANGMNGMAVSPNWLYMYDGITLKQLIKNTGGLNNTATLPGTTSFDWGGLDVDLCDDIYVGNQTNVMVYNSSLTQTGTIGPFSGNVYDVVLGNGVLSAQDSTLYVCGNGFLSSIKLSTPNSATITKTRTLSCSCNCTATGTVSFCGSPYAGPATYSWSNGQTTQTATGLCPGNTYTLTIILGCANQVQDTFNFPIGGSLNVTTSVTPVSCGSLGTATATGSGGVSPYTYSWSPGGQTTSSISGLSAGTYTVLVSDNTGCSNTTTVIITSSSGISATITNTTGVSCRGGSDGTATVSASGGTSPYTYSWAATGGTNATGTGMIAGPYTVTVTDNTGCTGTALATITQPANAISISLSSIPTSCGGNNGSATVIATGGTPGYTYTWNPGGQTNASATGLSVGTYTITIRDANGCTLIANISVLASASITTSMANTNVSCNGGSDGTATATASNGLSPYTYSWTPAGGNGSTGTGLSTGTYTVTITDNSGCSSTTSVTITEPTAINLTASSTQSTCGGNDGTATVSASGGTPLYTYSWNPSGNTNSTVTGIGAGTYTVTVTDNNGCTQTASVIVTSTSGISETITGSTGTSCNGGSDGNATAAGASGTAPYTYSWSPIGGTNATGTGLSAGTYTVTVTDANGCNANATVTITEPPLLTATMGVPTNILCNGGNNGSATVTAAGGTLGYTYLWASLGGTNATGTGLIAGTYTVTVTDANGCTTSATATITEPPPLTATMGVPINVLCNGGNNGSATVSAGGGSAPYTYAWASSGGTNATGTGLAAGTYTVTVTDNNNCIATADVTITEPVALSATTATTQSSCGNNNGTATVTAAGGTPAYTYFWNPSGSTNLTATGLGVGTYTVTVTDNNGCTFTITAAVSSSSGLAASITGSVNVSCNGGNDGTALATATGGSPAYTYNWLPAGGTTAFATGLSAGTYTVTVTDSAGCNANAVVVITEPPVLTATISSSSNLTCNGTGNGSATVTAAGGSPGYAYSWSPSGGNSSTANGLNAGTYTVTITDNNSCTATASLIITAPPTLTASIGVPANISCNGGTNGSATATATGGSSPYTYSWTPSGANTATDAGLSAGTYTVTVTDNNGCTSTATVTVTQPAPLSLSLTPVNISCFGNSNGSISSTAAGGTAPYTYAWTPSGGNGATASNLSAGVYVLNMSDANGCSASASATITSPAALVVSASGPGTVCSGANATLTSAVSGGTSPYNYSWSSGGGNASTATVNPASTTTYTLVITDANGCTATAAVMVATDAPLGVNISGAASFCPGDSAILTASATGGDGVYTYLWLPGGSTTYSLTATPSSTTIYTVQVSDGCGSAPATASVTVTVYAQPLTNFEATLTSGCVPLCVQFRDLSTVSGGGSIVQWDWSFGLNDTTNSKDPIFCFPDTGSFSVVLTTTTDGGCRNTLIKSNMIRVYPLPKVNFTYSPQPVNILSPTVYFTSTSSDKSALTFWYWTFGDGSDPSNLIDPQHTYSDTGTYCATLVAGDQHGCIDSITNCIIVNPDFTLYIPDAFTPNGDGLNEIFKPKGSYIKDYDMYIFNRWEAQIFHSSDMNIGWNGAVNNTGSTCQQDTYFYLINITDTKGHPHSYTGMVNLIR